MPERRSRQIVSAIEPTIAQLVHQLAAKKEKSTSEYVRSLLLEDLTSHGLLTERIVRTVLE